MSHNTSPNNYKSKMREQIKLYSKQIKEQNHELVEEQRKANKRPGMYIAKRLEREQMLKSKENNIERAKRREARKKRAEEEEARFATEKQLKTLFNMHKTDKSKVSQNEKVIKRIYLLIETIKLEIKA